MATSPERKTFVFVRVSSVVPSLLDLSLFATKYMSASVFESFIYTVDEVLNVWFKYIYETT